MSAPWTAPHRATPLDAQVLVPGSKSLTNRLLVLAALGDGPSVLTRPLASRDTHLMADALVVARRPHRAATAPAWTITPRAGRRRRATSPSTAGSPAPSCASCHRSPRSATRPSPSTATSAPAYVRCRPRSPRCGRWASRSTTAAARPCRSPFTARGHVAGGELEIDASASSQFVSALLLAAPRFDAGSTLHHAGGTAAVAAAHRHDGRRAAPTRRRRRRLTTRRWVVAARPDRGARRRRRAGPVQRRRRSSPRPWSPAGRCASPTGPSRPPRPATPGAAIAEAFGGRVERDGDDLVFTAGETLDGVELDLHDVGELTPVVAAVAALADGRVPAHRHRPPARPRDRPAGRARHRDQPARRRRRGDRRRADHPSAAAPRRRRSTPTTTTGWPRPPP